MRESDLYVPVRDWLRVRGWTIHVEVFEADVVGVREGSLLALELKLDNPGALITQLNLRSNWADLCVGAMPHRPKNISVFQYYGYGLLVVSGGKVREVVHPRPQPDSWHRRRAYRLKKLATRPPAADDHLAGLPACPALRAQRASIASCPTNAASS